MKVLTVFSHPRRQSLSGAVLDAFTDGLRAAGHEVEIADLHGEGFDPVMIEADEPDWDDSRKRYSAAVLQEQARITRNDALAFVFPVWWWSLPAMLKGWIDRVWNNGWAYGDTKLPHRRAVLLALAAGGAKSYRERGYLAAMETQVVQGIMDYCGIADAKLHMLYDTLDSEEVRKGMLARAREIGRDFGGPEA
ncbi:MAG TPA: NAD(P)H oxidoreductase [Dongiaceae bacterium]|jgi:NAD(P)H dehydrogenase (quinone)